METIINTTEKTINNSINGDPELSKNNESSKNSFSISQNLDELEASSITEQIEIEEIPITEILTNFKLAKKEIDNQIEIVKNANEKIIKKSYFITNNDLYKQVNYIYEVFKKSLQDYNSNKENFIFDLKGNLEILASEFQTSFNDINEIYNFVKNFKRPEITNLNVSKNQDKLETNFIYVFNEFQDLIVFKNDIYYFSNFTNLIKKVHEHIFNEPLNDNNHISAKNIIKYNKNLKQQSGTFTYKETTFFYIQTQNKLDLIKENNLYYFEDFENKMHNFDYKQVKTFLSNL